MLAFDESPTRLSTSCITPYCQCDTCRHWRLVFSERRRAAIPQHPLHQPSPFQRDERETHISADLVDVTLESEFVAVCYSGLTLNNSGVSIADLTKRVFDQLRDSMKNQSTLIQAMIRKIPTHRRANNQSFWKELIGLLGQHGYLIERRKFTQYKDNRTRLMCDTSHLEVSLSEVHGQPLTRSATRHSLPTAGVATQLAAGVDLHGNKETIPPAVPYAKVQFYKFVSMRDGPG